MNGKDLDRAYFDRFAQGYNPYTESDLDMLTEALIGIVGRMPAPRICEVGCASGQFSVALARRLRHPRATFFGLDIARNALAVNPFHKICGDAFHIPVRDSAFDVVCFPGSLHHLAPFDASVAELSRVLAPGGYAFCVEPNYFHPQRRLFMSHPAFYRLYRRANDVPIDPYALQSLLDNHGIRTLDMRFLNIHFREPGVLQRMQNLIASLDVPHNWHRFVLPWFLLVGEKTATATGTER